MGFAPIKWTCTAFFWPRQLTDRAILAIRQTQDSEEYLLWGPNQLVFVAKATCNNLSTIGIYSFKWKKQITALGNSKNIRGWLLKSWGAAYQRNDNFHIRRLGLASHWKGNFNFTYFFWFLPKKLDWGLLVWREQFFIGCLEIVQLVICIPLFILSDLA